MSYKDDQFFARGRLLNAKRPLLTKIVNKFNIDAIFDPTCGNGRYISYIQKCFPGISILANDIDPDMVKKVVGAMNYDFLAVDWTKAFADVGEDSRRILIATGYPYGKAKGRYNKDNDLALKCLNHAAKHFVHQCVVMPAGIDKPARLNGVNAGLTLRFTEYAPRNSFYRPSIGEIADIGSKIQYWTNYGNMKKVSIRNWHEDFDFVGGPRNADIILHVRQRNDVREFSYANMCYSWSDHLFIKAKNNQAYCRLRKTIDEFNWRLLLQNAVGCGRITEDEFVLAHEYIHKGKHADYIKLMSS